jgi:hypothetical protein
MMGIGGILLLILGPRFLAADLQGMRRQLSGAESVAPDPAQWQEAGSDRPDVRFSDSPTVSESRFALGALFDLLCLAGIVISLALGIAEARRWRPPASMRYFSIR